MPNETTTETDLTCPKCAGRGFISGLAGCSGFGDPEEEYVTEECGCFAGTLRCGSCLREEAVAVVADGTAEGMPLGERCKREADEARAERFRELDREWLAAGAEIRGERTRGAA